MSLNQTLPLTSASSVPDLDGQQSLRVRLDLAYDGAGFSGWAAQPQMRTVEGELTAALRTVLRYPLRLTVAGRTDAGVHAAAQCAHFDLPVPFWQQLTDRSGRCPEQILRARTTGVLCRRAQMAAQQGLIAPLPRGASDIVLHAVNLVPSSFDARFSALQRRYVYRIDAGGQGHRDPLRRGNVLWLEQDLDVAAMASSTQALLGEHDFLSYCKPRLGATTIRTLRELSWQRPTAGADAGLITLTVSADAFCHSMVRSLVGAGIEVGKGKKDSTWPAQLLAERSRHRAAPVAPAHGLTLVQVTYPPESAFALQAARARVKRTLSGESCCD